MDENTKKPEKKTAFLGTKITPGLLGQLDALAERKRRSRSDMACLLLEKAIAEVEKGEGVTV
jgi:hypothetical protein